MIQHQIPTDSNYPFSKFNYYHLADKKAEPSASNQQLHSADPESKLLFIMKSQQTLTKNQFIGISYVQDFLLALYRRNRSINTLQAHFSGICQFLKFLKKIDRQRFEEISCDDLSAYIEYEQDQGKKPMTVHTRLRSLKAFFNYHIDRGNMDSAILKRKLTIKIPQRLPRAIDPEDIRLLLAVIEKTRDRAMILTLLRTGMRIGELLNTQIGEVNLLEKRIEIYQAHKNLTGRVVYLSDDAQVALDKWMKMRDPDMPYLFYSKRKGRGGPLSYEGARMMFQNYLLKAELSHKGYTLHSLRHTFASELLNAGMRLECLQQLLGHSDIEMTRIYARLTDITRRDEYFKAMAIIEKGEINGHYRRGYPIS